MVHTANGRRDLVLPKLEFQSPVTLGSANTFRSYDNHAGMLRQMHRRIERPNKAIFHDASQGNRTPS